MSCPPSDSIQKTALAVDDCRIVRGHRVVADVRLSHEGGTSFESTFLENAIAHAVLQIEMDGCMNMDELLSWIRVRAVSRRVEGVKMLFTVTSQPTRAHPEALISLEISVFMDGGVAMRRFDIRIFDTSELFLFLQAVCLWDGAPIWREV